MFGLNDNKVGSTIEQMEQKLKDLEANATTNKTGYWQRLTAHCEKMSADQLKFIDTNKKVIEAKAVMMNAFNLYLFERFKEDFAGVEKLQPICNEYINSILQASDSYADVLANTLKENEELKKRLEELERKQSDKNNSKRA
jgi:hypothetical protein